MVNLQALADAYEALFHQRRLEQEERDAAFKRCEENPTSTRVFRQDWTSVTSPLSYLEQRGERLFVRSRYDDAITAIYEADEWREATTYLHGEELETRKPHQGVIRDAS